MNPLEYYNYLLCKEVWPVQHVYCYFQSYPLMTPIPLEQ